MRKQLNVRKRRSANTAAHEEKDAGRLIETRMEKLTLALEHLGLPFALRRAIAFQLAELSPEFEDILNLFNKADKGEHVSREELENLHGSVHFHWPMHIKPLIKHLRQAFDTLDSTGARRLRKGVQR